MQPRHTVLSLSPLSLSPFSLSPWPWFHRLAIAEIDRVLANEFGASDDGRHDRLTEFSKPLTDAHDLAAALEVVTALAAPGGATGETRGAR